MFAWADTPETFSFRWLVPELCFVEVRSILVIQLEARFVTFARPAAQAQVTRSTYRSSHHTQLRSSRSGRGPSCFAIAIPLAPTFGLVDFRGCHLPGFARRLRIVFLFMVSQLSRENAHLGAGPV